MYPIKEDTSDRMRGLEMKRRVDSTSDKKGADV